MVNHRKSARRPAEGYRRPRKRFARMHFDSDRDSRHDHDIQRGQGRRLSGANPTWADSLSFPVDAARRDGSCPPVLCADANVSVQRLAGTADAICSAGCGEAFWEGEPSAKEDTQHAGKYHAERIVPARGNAPVSPWSVSPGRQTQHIVLVAAEPFGMANPRQRGIPQHVGKHHAERIIPGHERTPRFPHGASRREGRHNIQRGLLRNFSGWWILRAGGSLNTPGNTTQSG